MTTYPISWRKGKSKTLSFKGDKLLTDDPNDLSADSISVAVNIRENKINDAVLMSNDDNGKTYLTNLDIGDLLTVNFAYVDDNTENWTKVFYGIVVGKEPVMDADGGSICKVQLYAYPAIALNRMRALGAYSLYPENLDTLREILCGKDIGSDTDFPNYEYFTEDGTVNNSSTWQSPTADSDWQKNSAGGFTAVMAKTSGGATNDSDYCVAILGGGSGGLADYSISSYVDSHGFPLFIDQFSNPQYDAANGTWNNIPYLTFYVKRNNMDCWLDIQLRRSGSDYLEFECDKAYTQDAETFHLIDDDGSWHKIEIPVGRHWNKAPILVDGIGTVQAYMNANYIGDPLNKWFGWNVRHCGESGSGSSADQNGTLGGSWNDITDINWHLIGIGVAATQYYLDKITVAPLNKQYGIIPAHVNKYFNYEDSGYDIDTDYIFGVQKVPFSKFIYQPVTKCLQDIINLVSGYNWLEEQGVGIHWIMIDDKLCIAPINDHHVAGNGTYIDDIWALESKYTEQKPLVVSEDIIRSQFRHYESEANFVIVNGLYQTPPEAAWTNTSPANHILVGSASNEYGGAHLTDIIDVGVGSYQAKWRVSFAHYNSDSEAHAYRVELTKNCVIGPNALRFIVPSNLIGTGAPLQALLVFADPTGIFNNTDYPILFNNAIDLNTLQNPELRFWAIARDVGPDKTKFKIKIFTENFFNAITISSYFGDGDGNYFEKEVSLGTATDDVWTRYVYQIGEGSAGWVAHGDANWSKPIVGILFYAVQNITSSEWFILDGINISSSTIRVAKSSKAIERQGGIKTKLINELLIQGYYNGSDEYDALDQLVVAECLRCVGMLETVSTPTNETYSTNDCEDKTTGWTGTLDYVTVEGSAPHGDYWHHYLVTYPDDDTRSWYWTPDDSPITVNTNDVWMKFYYKHHFMETYPDGLVEVLFRFNNLLAGILVTSNNGYDAKCVPFLSGNTSDIPFDLLQDQTYELWLHVYKSGPNFTLELWENEVLRGTAISSVPIGDLTTFIDETFNSWGSNSFYYDYLRVVSPPLVDTIQRVPITTGSVTIPYDPDLLGGQRVWIKSPTFNNVPKCFRILYITHTYTSIDGALSRLYLTDDLSNSYTQDPTDLANIAIKTVNPDFQSRDYTRLKLGSVAWNSVMCKVIDVDKL
jgi:hypothetical protein